MPTTFEEQTVTVWKFNPKPDITAYELAQALIYLDRSAWHQMPMTTEIVQFPNSTGFPEEIARHFEQVDERVVSVPKIQDTRIWEEHSIGEIENALSGLSDEKPVELADLDQEGLDAPV